MKEAETRAAELFHQLWSKARGNSPERPADYDKSKWIELQNLLHRLGIPA